MSMLFTIWKAHLKSAYNALRTDTRMRITWLIALALDFAVGAWSVNTLIARLSQWHAAGPTALANGLWLLCLIGWAGISLFTVLSTLQLGFSNLGIGSDSALLLMTLPILPATRFRALYGLMFFEGIGNWLLLEMSIMGIALTIVLGWQALIWLVFLLVGTCVAVWCSMVATLLVIRYILPNVRKVLLVAIVGISLVGVGLATARVATTLHLFSVWSWKYSGHTIPQIASLAVATTLALPGPELSSILLVLMLIVLIGPLANRVGKLYVAAFHTMEASAGSSAVLTLPGIRPITNLLGRYRNLTSALLYKGLLNQSRHPFTWARLIIVLVGLLLFPEIQNLLAHYEFSHMFIVAAYSSILAILAIIELAPYAISSEGNRLALYLVAPLNAGDILRARLIVFLCPALFIGLASSFILSWEIGLPAVELPLIIIIIALIVIAYTAFVVWASAFDEDLNLAVEGKMETLFHEELPFTPRRMQLLGLGLLLFALMLFLVWKVPVMLAIPALVLLNGLVLVGMWHVSRIHLGQLLKKG